MLYNEGETVLIIKGRIYTAVLGSGVSYDNISFDKYMCVGGCLSSCLLLIFLSTVCLLTYQNVAMNSKFYIYI